jgi:hypothetical protein
VWRTAAAPFTVGRTTTFLLQQPLQTGGQMGALAQA